jgi:hypothetical protein
LASGVKVKPYEVLLRKGPILHSTPRGQFSLYTEWGWRWPLPLFYWWSRKGLPFKSLGRSTWLDFHPCLFSEVKFKISHPGVPPPQSLLLDAVRPDGVNWV